MQPSHPSMLMFEKIIPSGEQLSAEHCPYAGPFTLPRCNLDVPQRIQGGPKRQNYGANNKYPV